MTGRGGSGWRWRFFSIWTGQQLSLLGSWIAQFGLVWWLTRETGSATVLATASLVALLPHILIGPFAGTFVDRMPRRWLMVWVDCGVAALAGLLGLLFWAGAIQVWHIFLVMALRAVGGALHWPAMAAATSLLVPEGHLTRIAGLNQTMQGLLSLISPPLGAMAVSLLPMHGVMGIDFFTFGFALGPLLFFSIPEPERSTASSSSSTYFSDLKEGFRYVWGWRGLFLFLCFAALINFIGQPIGTLLPLLVREYFGKGAIELGWLESAWGAGVILGGLFLGAWGGFKRKIHTILLGIFGMGASVGAVGLLPSWAFYLALGLFFLFGFMHPFANATFMALIQSVVDRGIQGRVFSLMSSMSQGMMPLSLILAGPLAEIFGVRFWYLVGGIGVIVLGALTFAIPDILHLEASSPKREPKGR